MLRCLGPLLTLAWPLASADHAIAQVLNLRTYLHADGLPQIQVVALHQDARGFIWLGTYGGVTRYDGRTFTTLTVADGLGSNRVSDLDELPSGEIVAGTVGGGVCFLSGGTASCLRSADGLPSDVVTDVHVSPDGGLWVGTGAGLGRVRDGRVVRTYTRTDGLPSDEVSSIAGTSDGRLWIATGEGIAVLREGRFEPVAAAETGEEATFLFGWGDSLIVSGRSGSYLQTADGQRPIALPDAPPSTPVRDAAGDGGGGVWLATQAGAFHLGDGGARRLTTRNGLASDALHRVLVDREGSVWFGSDGGLSKLVPGPFTLLSDGLIHPFVRAVAEDVRGRVWVGTRVGAAILEDGRFRPVALPPGVSDPRVYALAAGAAGEMWVGTRDGLVRYAADGSALRYGTEDGLPSDYVANLLHDDRGLWIGTEHGLAHMEGGTIRSVDHPLTEGSFVVSSALDDRGRMWFGLNLGGVLVFDGSTWTSIASEQGFTDQTVWSLHPDSNGSMWAGTNGHGAFHVREDGLRRYHTADGLVDDFVWQVLPAGDGSVWMFTSHGLDRLTGGSFVHFGPEQGLSDREGTATAALEDSNGQLWFGSGSGLYRYDPSFRSPELPPPPIYIEALTAGGSSYPVAGARIAPEAGVLAVRFASPSFRSESAIRFRYRIPSVSESWSEPAPEAVVQLAGLGPGRHTLEVVAVDRDGRQSLRPAAASFTVLPRFWESLWFRVVTVLLAMATVAGLVNARTRRLEADRRRLEALVDARTRELKDKTNRLEAEAVERERLQAQLNQAQKMEAVGRLAGGIAHDFNNLLTVILGHVQLLASDPGTPDGIRDDVVAVQSAAERGASLVAQLLAFSRRQMVRSERLDLNDAIARSMRLLGRLINDDVALEVEPSGGPAFVNVDQTHLDQVLVNLVVNASDAMPGGGRLRISVTQERVGVALPSPGPDEVPPGAYVLLTVTDTGLGMPPHVRERAFEPFFTTKDVGRGTGLGLSTVYGMVHQCEGYIQLVSDEGRGTEVRVFLPNAADNGSRPPRAPAAAGAPAHDA